MNPRQVKKLYKNVSKPVQAYMCQLYDSLQKKYGHVDETWPASLGLIALNYNIVLECQEDIRVNGFNVKGEGGKITKNGSISVLNLCQGQLLRLLQNFGLTPMANSRIKAGDMAPEALLNDILE
jgi:phage terminase small subunit